MYDLTTLFYWFYCYFAIKTLHFKLINHSFHWKNEFIVGYGLPLNFYLYYYTIQWFCNNNVYLFMINWLEIWNQKRFYNRESIEIWNTANIFHTPLPFYATQLISHILNSRISANHIKWRGFHPIVKSLKRGLFLYCTFSFIYIIQTYSINSYFHLNTIFKVYYGINFKLGFKLVKYDVIICYFRAIIFFI